jgi:hypothetical protein
MINAIICNVSHDEDDDLNDNENNSHRSAYLSSPKV